MELNDLEGPMISISASGMATGGRVLHHLARRRPDERSTVMLVGYQDRRMARGLGLSSRPKWRDLAPPGAILSTFSTYA